VWTQANLAALKAEMAPLVKAADAEKAKRKDAQYDVFVAARNQAWAAILDQVANKTQELLPAYNAWLQEQRYATYGARESRFTLSGIPDALHLYVTVLQYGGCRQHQPRQLGIVPGQDGHSEELECRIL